MFPTLEDKFYFALGGIFWGIIMVEAGYVGVELMFALRILKHVPNIHIW